MRSYLDFEKPVAELEARVEELRALQPDDEGAAIGEEINRIEVKAGQALKDLYAGLTPWQKTQVARHPQRPHSVDYIAALIEDFVPSRVTASSVTITPSSAASAASAARASASSVTRKAPIPRAGSSTISAWRGRRVIAKPCA